MEQQSSKTNIYQINADNTDFYSGNVKEVVSNINLQKDLLNTATSQEIASEILNRSQFSQEYRKQLVSKIKEQYKSGSIVLEQDSLVNKNIESLAEDNTLTVTTGQQIHIFLGPFFVVNKLLSCCAEAIKINSLLTDYQIVPIFWMASEDHDFDEIKSARLYNEMYTWDIDSSGPVGRLNPKSLLPIVQQAKQRIDQTDENINFLEVCEFAYSTCKTFADATRYIIHQLFQETGIVVVDPDDAFFKSQFTELFKADLYTHEPSIEIDRSIQTMKTYGIKAPINTRPINTFYITDEKRVRIEKTGLKTFSLVDGSEQFTESEVSKLLDKNPEKFSPNALLRPAFQQKILPNISYITGASETIYWLELKNLMESNEITYPELQIRKSCFFTSEKKINNLKNNGIEVEHLFSSASRFKELTLSSQQSVMTEIDDKITKSKILLNEVLESYQQLGSTQTRKLQKTHNQLINALNDEQERLVDTLTKSNPVYNQSLKIKSSLFHDSYVQERNKFIISMLTELRKSIDLHKSSPAYYTNHKIITLISQ